MNDEVIDAICAGVKREPLTHPHNATPHRTGDVWGCELGEAQRKDGVDHSRLCTGCAVRKAVRVVEEPARVWTDSDTGELLPGIELFRRYLDELHPLRVLVERELARRALPPSEREWDEETQ